MGPKSDLEAIKPHMDGRLPIKFVDLDSGALLLNPLPTGCQDTHITILPEFKIPEGRMEEFIAGFEKFYTATKTGAGAAGMLYYGFAVVGDSVYCREGYKVIFLEPVLVPYKGRLQKEGLNSTFIRLGDK